MNVNDDFWEDLLGHIRQQVLVTVVGPDLTVVNVGNAKQTFTTLIGQRLAEKYDLNVSPGMTTMGEAVAVFLRKPGGRVERLYGVINNIMLIARDPSLTQSPPRRAWLQTTLSWPTFNKLGVKWSNPCS